MGYKSKKKLSRDRAGFGVGDGLIAASILAGFAQNLMGQKQQAKAVEQQAKTQADAIRQQSAITAKAISEQNQNNTQLAENNIQAQKELTNSQNEIFKDMNMNLALQAGAQNETERKQQSKIVVRCGGNLNRRKKLNRGITLQDNNYLLPIGDGAYLLRGGSPGNPQDQTHDNTHKNTKNGGSNTGSYLKVNGREIEAEGGGLQTPGEIVDPNRNIILSQRHILPDGTSPVEEVLYKGKTIDQAFANQETTKAMLGVKDNGNTAKLGKRFLANGGRIKAKKGYDPYAYTPWYPGNTSSELPSVTSNPDVTGKSGSWWSRQNPATQSSLINAGTSLFGTGLSILGNGLASGYMQRANEYGNQQLAEANDAARDVYIKAYNQMHGVDINNLLAKDAFQTAHAIANVRAGRYNINPQLQQIERDMLRQQEQINKTTNSGVGRQRLLARVMQNAQDERSKWFAEQANRIEAINQGNISELNKMANENANRDTKALFDRNNAYITLAQYNNDIENSKIQGIADATVNALTNNAQGLAQTRINNAGLRGNFATNAGNQLATMFNTAANVYNNNRTNWENNQTAIQTAMISSTNPNGHAQMIINNPKNYDTSTIKTQFTLATDNTIKNELRKILKTRGVNV